MNALNIISHTQFTSEQAVALLHREVAQRSVAKRDQLKNENIGLVVGVLSINDEMEVVVKQLSDVGQYTASEFHKKFEVVPD